MSSRSLGLDDRLYAYLLDVSLREPEVLTRLRAETERMPESNMLLAPEQAQFLGLLVELTQARRIVEVGTFTGYSTAWMALSQPVGGHVVACDVSDDYTRIARRAWAELGVGNRIDLRLAPAVQTLDGLIADGGRGAWDLVFVDADKESYDAYYERALTLLRPGGLLVADNVLWGGSVVNPDKTDADTEAIRAFNAKLRDDDRITLSLVPIGDGLTLARKR
jgi:caffeoyl-CoA O-methyltransferase